VSVVPDPGAAAGQRADALCDLGRFPDAVRVLSEALASDPQNLQAWCVLSRAQLGQKRHREALEAGRRASAIDPEYEWPHRLMSLAWSGTGDHRQAARCAEEAVRLAPHEWRTHLRLAQALRGIPDPAATRQAIDRALELAPNEPDVHLTSGAIALAAGRRDQAVAAFTRALELDPNSSAAHQALAAARVPRRRISSVNAGRLAGAAGGFAAAIRTDPRSEQSRRALDAVLGLFLRLAAYFLFLDAWISLWTRHSSSTAARLVPVALLAAPLGYALWFIMRLPRDLRPYLVRHAFAGGKAAATIAELGAVAALVLSAMVAAGTRDTLIGLAVFGGIVARIVLYTLRRAQ
jgi:tetratricopeptide (TPR) repeat protein